MKKIKKKVIAIPPTVKTRGLPCKDFREVVDSIVVYKQKYIEKNQ